MKQGSRWLAVAGLTLIGVDPTPRERTACEGATRMPTLDILVVDYQRIPRHIWTRAEQHVTLVYRSIPVETTWRRVRPRPDSDATAPLTVAPPDGGSLFTILIPSRPMAEWTGDGSNVLGVTPYSVDRRGRLAYVFYDRIDALARLTGVDEAQILAYVLAHEIGHLLLPVGAHADAGLMRRSIDLRNLRNTVRDRLSFSTEQTDLLRGSAPCE